MLQIPTSVLRSRRLRAALSYEIMSPREQACLAQGWLAEALFDIHQGEGGQSAAALVREIHEEYGRRLAALLEEPTDEWAFHKRNHDVQTRMEAFE